jgi:NAD(P)-dependent dehydrogenase (short-subunit alcohol dehydrogenase family)
VGEADIVSNAGYFPNRPIEELDLPTWRKTIAASLDSHFFSAKYFLPAMRKKKWGALGRIGSNHNAAPSDIRSALIAAGKSRIISSRVRPAGPELKQKVLNVSTKGSQKCSSNCLSQLVVGACSVDAK